jgi:hypothetical protein
MIAKKSRQESKGADSGSGVEILVSYFSIIDSVEKKYTVSNVLIVLVTGKNWWLQLKPVYSVPGHHLRQRYCTGTGSVPVYSSVPLLPVLIFICFVF